MKKPNNKSPKKTPSKNLKGENFSQNLGDVVWTVHGPRWNFICKAKTNACPIEVATKALERIWNEEEDYENLLGSSENWKKTSKVADNLGQLFIEEGEEPTLGILLEVSNQTMEDQSQHIMMPTAIVLANAGLHNESVRLEKFWKDLPHQQQLEELLNILNQEQENE